MKLTDTIVVLPEVMARQVGDELVILDLTAGIYFGLDAVGTRIWQFISEGRNVGQIIDALLAEYEVSPEQLAGDVERLLVELETRRLISTSAAAQ